MARQIDIFQNSKCSECDVKKLRTFIRKLDERLPKKLRAPSGVLSIAIVDDAELAKIHGQFLNDPEKTDVITFPSDEKGFSGEICASAERALKTAKKFSNTPNRELALYVAHGYLHLAGLDDIEICDAAKMRKAEAEAMRIFDSSFKKPVFNFKIEK